LKAHEAVPPKPRFRLLEGRIRTGFLSGPFRQFLALLFNPMLS
jgi:hypothetical protein